ncbi:MAG: GDSL-type esterase/lipase family protein [Deltaproteobacteria bacterium]|jgi:lysophospholipase L1-like esterase|nr:GDSL-type esterase/lipase family protein [Deltaproteobacteria bacterium]
MTKDLTDTIVLLGDSLTEFWNWSDLDQRFRAVNHGIAGDTSMGLLSRVRYATEQKPRLISLQVGINDLSQGIPPAEVADNHLAIWREINRQSPKTHLIVCSLMPIRLDKLGWVSVTLDNAKVRQTNEALKANLEAAKGGAIEGLPFEGGISWLDLYGLCADAEGELPDHMTDDGVHLTWSAYWAWTEALREHLKSVVD